MEQDYVYFAEELQDITSRIIPTSFGNLHALTAGMPGQPLILVVHGSGPKNSSAQYSYLLHQYLVRVSYLEKFYIVAIDCPGYGQSEGRKEAVRTFPLQLFKQILQALSYKSYFAMFGHSQGGASIFNAVYESPEITQFLVMDRPVCGNIQRFKKFSLPTLLIYDIEDDGHPIWQGKLLYKQLLKTELYTYRGSLHPFWVPDNIWEKMLNFFAKQHKRESKVHVSFEGERRNRSTSNKKIESREKPKVKKNISVDRISEIKKNQIKAIQLLQIEEIERSELMSLPSSDFPSEEEKQQILRNHSSDQSKSESVEEQKVEKKARMPPRFIELKITPKAPKLQTPPQPKVQELAQPQQQKQTKNQVSLQECQQNNRCAICYETLYRPVVTNCNHIFCNKCMLESLLVNEKCPLCRAKVTKKTQNKELQEKIINEMPPSEKVRRQKEFVKVETMMKSIVYIEIGNTSRELATKQSAFTKTKKKYIWELFVKPPRGFYIQEAAFNINMGDRDSRPVRVKNAPYTFESRGTFSFDCEITIKPKNAEYAPLTAIYRIDIEPGYHSKKVALRKKCYMK